MQKSLSTHHLHFSLHTLTLGVAGILLLIALTATGVFAQGWQDPGSNIPSTPGDPNVDPPIYSGSVAEYGGSAQYRNGPLTLGQTTPVLTETLYVAGNVLATDKILGGAGNYTTIAAGVAALGDPESGVYGTTASALRSGVYAVTDAVSGTALWGDAEDVTDGIGVHGISTASTGYGIMGLSTETTGYAGYFTGQVKIASVGGGAVGSLTSEGPMVYSSSVSVLGSTVTAASLLLNGVLFDPATVNALSVQDMLSGTYPFTQPGLRTFTLSTSDTPCMSGGVACPADGILAAGATAEWHLGPLGVGGNGFFADKRKMVYSYQVQYSLDRENTWHTYAPANGAGRVYEECNSTGQSVLGKFSITNSLNLQANFRIIVWYKEFAIAQICDPTQHYRQVTVAESVDLGDTIRVYLDSGTNPTASEIFAQTTEDDIRVLYTPTGGELDRDVTLFSTSSIEVFFKAQVATGGVDLTNYLLFYGGSGNPIPPPQDLNNVYLLWDDFADASIDAAKWGTTVKPAGCTTIDQNGDVRINHNGVLCYTGGSLFSANAYSNTGKYTLLYDLIPESTDGAGNDGLYFRYPASARETTYYYGPTERALYIGHASSCSSAGIYVYNYYDKTPATENNWVCGWAPLGYRIGTYVHSYTDGSPFTFKVRYDADYHDGGGEIPTTLKGFVEVFEPVSTMRVWGAMRDESYDSIGATFVIEFHDGYYSGTPVGTEKIDDVYLRRGKLSYDIPTTLGPEQ